MTIQEYQDLTGNHVSDADVTRMKAVIRRAETKLGTLLGYSLSKSKKWTELGRVRYDGIIPFPSLPLSDAVIDNLLPASEQEGDIQLFSYDSLDTHFRINPAKEVYSVKLVYPVSEDEFVTVQELSGFQPYLNDAGLIVAVTRDTNWFQWSWYDGLALRDRSNLLIAVDANYVNVCQAGKYDDLAYLLTDMIDYYSDPNYSVMGNIRSESIDSHSYSRAPTGQTIDSMAPQGQPDAKKVIEKYAGPGAFRKLVR